MRDFLNDYTIFIALGILFVLLAVYLLFRRKKRLDIETKNDFKEEKPTKIESDDAVKVASEKVDNQTIEDKPLTTSTNLTSKKETIKKAEESPKITVVETKKVMNEDSSEEDDPKKDKIEKGRPLKYHISQNKDETSPHYKKWRVRKEGSDKTIKYYNTQKKAIEVAEDLAEKAGSSIVIHKVDGKIRKQDYWKKK
ncbi:MAG: DUF2188 domain-containing protein [Acholeplasmataceae bacterium]